MKTSSKMSSTSSPVPFESKSANPLETVASTSTPVQSSKSPSTLSSTKKSKKEEKVTKTSTEKEDYLTPSNHKTLIIGIYITIGIILIIYVIYIIEAVNKSWIPFGDFVTIPPEGGVQPTTTTTYNPNGTYDDQNERNIAAGYEKISQDQRDDAINKLADILYDNCAWKCMGKYLNGDEVVSESNYKPNVGKPLKPSYDKNKECTCSDYVLPRPTSDN